jgi:hypothetical protein
MGWNRILYGDQKSQKSRAAKEKAEKEARTKRLAIIGALSAVGVLILAIVLYATVFKGGRTGTSDPPVKVKMERLFELYERYIGDKKKPPPSEQVFKDYIRNLPKDERDRLGIGEDVDSFLVSPRDKQKYRIKYGIMRDPSDASQAIAWEETGKDGKRFVILGLGYVEERDEQSFNELKR